METKKTLPYLPEDLIIKILLRLQVKSLIRFKCICKSWLTLISDTHFANSHFEIMAATHTHRIMFISTSPPHQTQSIDFESSLRSASPNLNFLLPQTHSDLKIKGSCRGFILLRCSSEFHIWNPSTGLHKQIPLSTNDSYLDIKCLCYLYGFGYDQSTNDYLVVSMSYSYVHDTATDYIVSHLEFFSLRDNTWKEIEGTLFPYLNFSDGPPVGSLFKEVIHWLVFRVDISMYVIVAFDLMERKLLDMHLPDEFDGEHDYTGLWVFGEFLSVWAMDCDDNKFEIWVMKEYKVHSSWTKTHVISLDGIPINSPLCSTKSGDIIGTYDSAELIKYNDKGEFLEHTAYCNDSGTSQMALYVESLLSLPAANEQA
ncbi:unnamed protein product [Trifolium pratense]|uniref:Uncharacterized protein n=1 Tax=Trifolium pratense TaxID=57577 RepID=A0ACB0IRD8_TRIPR|nr:unnamed protein product [Trifolium pratense]